MAELKTSLFDEIQEIPKEHYTFRFTPEEANFVSNRVNKMMMTRFVLLIILSILLILCGFGIDEGFFIGFGTCSLILTSITFLKTLSVIKKNKEKADAIYPTSVFDYSLYDSFLIIHCTSDTKVHQDKIKIKDIKHVQNHSNIISMIIDGKIYMLRKDKLAENSYFLSLCKNKK